jgi:tetratricopeptide (TPR) repeat protein
MKLGLRSYTIDLPAGATNTVVEQRTVLPVDTELHAVLPHAHYLAKRVEGFAILPDGTRRSLLRIPDWDFNWQTEYRYATPVRLPRGTTLGMQYTYDNSTNNARNPHQPPRRVTFGLQTSDEMAELWFQLLATTRADFDKLAQAAQARTVVDIEELSRFKLRQNPNDAEAVSELGKVKLTTGDGPGAEALFRRALEIRPDLDDAHYHLGLVLLYTGRIADAEGEFLEAVRLNPEHFQARGNAGLCCLRQRRFEEAATHFREILRTRPGDTVARQNLELAERLRRGQPPAR